MWRLLRETLFVLFAAGNDGADNDPIPTSPANIKTDNTISVAATLDIASLASFSNYGAQMVEVAAPGVAINSTIPGDQFLSLSGTSMAAPYVTNAAELVKDANPALAPADVKKVLVGTVNKKSFLSGKVSSGGIVNTARAAKAAQLSLTESVDAAIAQALTEVPDMAPTITATHLNDRDLVIVPLPNPFQM